MFRPFRHAPPDKATFNARISDPQVSSRLQAHGLPVRRASYAEGTPECVLIEWRREPTDHERQFAAQMIPERTLSHAV